MPADFGPVGTMAWVSYQLNLSAYELAKRINVPISRIQDLLHDRRKITANASVRLGRLFGVSDRYFLNLQNDIELWKAEASNGSEYRLIKRYQLK